MSASVPIRIHAELQPILRVAAFAHGPLPESAGVDPGPEIERRCAAWRERWAGREPHEIEALDPARRLYRDLGIDPTRTRPSSEALLRRILRGDPFPRIHPAVDVGNLASLEFMLPVGIYDARCVEGEVEVRRGRPGEGYAGIRKERVNLEGRLAVCDTLGAFGNPTSDSDRAKVTGRTCRLLFLIFAPASLPEADRARHQALAADLYQRFLPV
jgi:DNA/RNA-binding domain of Phe-tRNA-synthetase-like protein